MGPDARQVPNCMHCDCVGIGELFTCWTGDSDMLTVESEARGVIISPAKGIHCFIAHSNWRGFC